MKKITKFSLLIISILILTACGGGGGSNETTVETETVSNEPQVTINKDYSYELTAKLTHVVYYRNPDWVKQVDYEIEIKDYEPNTNYYVKVLVDSQLAMSYADFGQDDSYVFIYSKTVFSNNVKYNLYGKYGGTLLLSKELDVSNLPITEETVVKTSV